MPAGVTLVSDASEFEVRACENLTVTIHCLKAPAELTGHPGSRTTSYLLAGDHATAADFPAAANTDRWYLLAAVDVVAPEAAAIAIIGDSITDGRGSNTNGNDRWPNLLGRRLQVLYPVVPLARRQALGIAVMSYDGHLGFGLLADYDALPELESIVGDLKWAIASLARAAGVRSGSARASAKPRKATRQSSRAAKPASAG